ncbi:hypothetical protein [Pseudomonas sp. WPR_5_2]|uniref:hypothetical protein n=1 Tax=Pseudomonas sp. WPR_5_2 TaxID=1907371 RepID=UPI0015A869E5|nr:hypothetical protein [Pseudomonas sp. WPR_5_2]
MESTTPKAAPAAVPMTPGQRLEALLEHTGDLDKAEVLQASIPEWLANADLNGVQALKSAFEQSFLAQARARTALEKLKPLDEFCKEQLTAFLNGTVPYRLLEQRRHSLTQLAPRDHGKLHFRGSEDRWDGGGISDTNRCQVSIRHCDYP